MGGIALAASLLGSIALNFVLYNVATQYYRQLNATHLDPLGLNVSFPDREKSVKLPSNKPKVVFFGDSRAAAWQEPEGFDNSIFINRGIGSQTTTQVAQRYDEHIAPLKPDILVVQVGVNDLKTIPLFPNRKKRIIEDCKANIDRILRDARSQNTVVILSTIFPVGELPIARRLFWSSEVDRAIKEVNEFIVSLAAEDVRIFDTKSILANENGIVQPEYSLDFLHLNDRGYEALNRELSLLLREIERGNG
ncbi:MAG TPA: SGNH/GDSL hydrolase family protein [Oscillatoriales cyanobacterium M4454_W2019_049]|nr:MAG: SGNH/GDSL hydrolase family protein [Cyanobacteria bacterium J055]HIK33624.1 SGNH/GDSL hydrolase family protein [Oscillatoriales cyanobacterium M4454_W2019_049]